jgi:F0F1-type ATP synthase assembly protein I
MSGAFEPSGVRSLRKLKARMDKKDSNSLAKYLELSLLIPISTFVGYGAGYGLDKLFGTHFLYVIFMVIGSAAGIIQVIRELS